MNNKGFTLIELIVGLAVGSIILAGVVGSIFTVMRLTPEIKDQIVVLSDLDRAAHWLTRDVQMGFDSDLLNNAPPVSQVTITWNDYTKAADLEGSIAHSVTYIWHSVNGTLQRTYDGEISLAGAYLTNVGFTRNDRSVTVTLTSSDGENVESTATRTFTILMRAEGGA